MVIPEVAGRAAAPTGLRGSHVAAITAAHCAAAFAALGLPPYLPRLLPELGDPQARWAGLLYVLPTLCTALAAPLWGRLADRYGRKPLLVRAQLGLAVAFAVAALADSITTLALALSVQGLLGGTYAASAAYLASGLRGRPLARALALMQGSARTALAAAPVLAGMLAAALDIRRMYGLAALLPLVAAVATMLLPEPTGGWTSERSGDTGATSPVSAPRTRITVSGLCLAEAGFVLATVVTFPYFLPLAGHLVPALPPAAGGLLFAAPHLCYLAAAAPALRWLRDRARLGLAVGYALTAASAAVHLIPVLAPGGAALAWLALGRLLLGAALTCGLTSLSLLAAEAATGRAPGRLFGLVEACSKAGAVLAGLAASALVGLGPAAPLAVAVVAGSALAAGAGRFTTPGSRAGDAHRTDPEVAVTAAAPTAARAIVPGAVPTEADLITAHTLLGCVVREVAVPDGQTRIDSGHLVVRLPYTGQLLRARLRRASTVAAHRFSGPVQQHTPGEGWAAVGLVRLVGLISVELSVRTGHGNEEFAVQVAASRDTLADILASRPAGPSRRTAAPAADYLDSEQALIAGHPRHPAPKWRSGDLAQWRSYAPEARTAFPLRWLAVPEELVREHAVDGDFDVHAGTAELLTADHVVPAGHRALPVHPWQFRMLVADLELGSVLRAALADGALRDLGEIGAPFHPTASVRTLYQPEVDRFLKTSLNVRITNCVRKNAAYELAGAVELTRLLAAPFGEVVAAHPGFGFLAEPAARSVELPARYGDLQQRHALLEGLGTIVRVGIGNQTHPGERVHLAGTLAAAQPDPAGTRTRLADLADLAGAGDSAAWARQWWQRYLDLLVPPVLRLWAEHGVVLEPHPQNVLAVCGPDQMPVRILARDMEGTKLLAHQHADTLAALPADVARAVAYDEEQGWNRIAYCLFVNHLTEIAGALADLAGGRPPGTCGFEDELWAMLADVVNEVSAELGHPPRLRAALSGVPLPAKSNLLIRWARRADRHAGYVPFPNPLGRPRASKPGLTVSHRSKEQCR